MSLTRAGDSPVLNASSDDDLTNGAQTKLLTTATMLAQPTPLHAAPAAATGSVVTQPKFEYASVLKGDEKRRVVGSRASSSPAPAGVTLLLTY